jgi:UDP-glucuronate 4-epimerase
MTVLVTGAAGFIGYHVAEALLARGERVIGVDILNDYYDVNLKNARRDRLKRHSGFKFVKIDICDKKAMFDLAAANSEITTIIHLAAQAGVRYSLQNPFAYIESNVIGHLVMLEMCRRMEGLKHFVYASSSSVYGGNTKMPFSVDDPTDTPVSIYAATKKADELMSHSYSHLFAIPATGLRFFTVYGPWGRPDMAAYIFLDALFSGKTIPVFNHGEMMRDFTYVDDIVKGVLAVADGPPSGDGAPHMVYNIGNNRSEPLMRFIGLIEKAAGRKAEIDFQPMQPGDVPATYADISAIQNDFGFEPSTTIDEGIPRFVEWYRSYYGVKQN